ncbi:MAG: class I SAM-dependent methyltransferase [Oscillospiraceae bacterium]
MWIGHNCIDFVNHGAKKVVEIDISQKMLEVAEKESVSKKITYINMSMTDIDKLNKSFDFIYNSLAFHYIKVRLIQKKIKSVVVRSQ